MFARIFALLSALALASPAAAADAAQLDTAKSAASQTGGQSYGDRNRGGPYGFYSYPRHRHIDGAGARQSPPSAFSGGTSPPDNTHGSAYYGRNYGAPYFGGGYYDDGTYYRERRD